MIAQSTRSQRMNKTATIIELYQQIRSTTMRIVGPLEIEDYVVQTAEFMSPPRWHIGHTAWFFETLLQTYEPGYRVYDEDFLFFFNSYYEGFGARIARARRGTRSRPTVRETVAYREYVDHAMLRFLERVEHREDAGRIYSLVRLGLEHEIQHQELLVYDIKHLLCNQYAAPGPSGWTNLKPAPTVAGAVDIAGGLFTLGYSGDEFAWDNEKPQHKVYLENYSIDRAPVSVGDYLQFIEAGGYADYRWWLSAAWETVKKESWEAPLYWELHDGEWMIRDFHGLHRAVERATEPVTHVSYYEADAFAKWAGKRLPTEAEWEKAAGFDPANNSKRAFPWGDAPPSAETTNLFEDQRWGVAPIGSFPKGQTATGVHQMIGDVWEWTTSDYAPYPGFTSEFDEYNDKWFVGQKVLRGGSFATPQIHIRSTYRNFFHPHERWMISGFRCAQTP
jgi:ergothioneine biosynthesis protein EgtB